MRVTLFPEQKIELKHEKGKGKGKEIEIELLHYLIAHTYLMMILKRFHMVG